MPIKSPTRLEQTNHLGIVHSRHARKTSFQSPLSLRTFVSSGLLRLQDRLGGRTLTCKVTTTVALMANNVRACDMGGKVRDALGGLRVATIELGFKANDAGRDGGDGEGVDGETVELGSDGCVLGGEAFGHDS